MTDLARNGSVLVAEIKAVHPPQEAVNGNGAVPHTNGDVPYTNGGVPHAEGAHPGTATDGGAAPALDPSYTTPKEHSQFSNGHAPEASALSAGTGAIAVNQHQADPSVASGVPTVGETGESAPGLIQPQTAPIQPIQPSERAMETSHINTAVPAAGAGTAPGSAISGTSPVAAQQSQQPELVEAVAAAAAAGAAGATAKPIVAHPAPTTMAATEAPKAALPPKEVKKMDKLMKTEAKNENKSIKHAIKDAASSEKLFRKSRDAEAQAVKRHQKATTNEHKAAKALSKAKAEHEKVAAELAKAVEDLEIKKRHTESTREGYEKAKRHIDELRNQKTVNDQARARQAANIHGPRV